MKLYLITVILATIVIVAVQSASLKTVSMDQPRCGVPDVDVDGMALSLGKKWEKNHITWSYRGSAPSQIGAQRTRQLLTDAFQKWADVVPLTFEQCSDCSADIVISTGYVDGVYLSTFFSIVCNSCFLLFLGKSGSVLAVAKFWKDGSIYFDGKVVNIVFDNEEFWTEQ